MTDRRFTLHLFALMIFAGGCSSGDRPLKADLLQDWVVVGATRDGRATGTINGAYFNFEDSRMETNFMGQQMSNTYRLKDDQILVGTEQKEYLIRYLDRDSLHLSVDIRGYPFEFFMHAKSNTQ